MAEKKKLKKELRKLEKKSKALVTDVLDVVKLQEDEKKKLKDAKLRDKARVVVDVMQQKKREAGHSLIRSLIKLDTRTNGTEGGWTRTTQKKNFSKKRELFSHILKYGLKYLIMVAQHSEALSGTKTRPIEPIESSNILKLCSPEEFQKLHKEKPEEIYPIKEKNNRTRQALIICNKEFDHLSLRSGAEYDIAGMKGLLESLDYTVKVKEKLTAKDMKLELKEFADLPEHKSSDSMFLVLMSHGTLHGICGTLHSDEDPDLLPYDSIFQIFNNRNCVSLKDKPKVIIVQACRGGNRGETWVSDSPAALDDSSFQSAMNLVEDGVHKTHVEKDFIAFYSSTPHNMSWRDKTRGSPFIKELINCFQTYSCCCHLEELFLKSTEDTAGS